MKRIPEWRLTASELVAAAISWPVLWLVALGMCAGLYLNPSTRWLGRRLVNEWGGWPAALLGAAAWTWVRLRLRPFCVLYVAAFVAGVAALIGGARWVPWALLVAMVTAMALPALDAERFTATPR